MFGIELYRRYFGRVDFEDGGLMLLRVLRRLIRRKIGGEVLDGKVGGLSGRKHRPWVLVVRMGSLDRVDGESFLLIFVERLCLLVERVY